MVVGGCERLNGPTVSATPIDPAAEKAGGEEKPREPVRLGTFSIGDVSTRLSVDADLEAIREADVFPEVTGIIDRIALRDAENGIEFREGDPVKKGDAVVLLVDDELRLVKENKELLLEQSRGKLDLASLAVREAEAAVRQKTVLVEKATKEWDRVRDRAGRIVSPEEADQKRYAMEQAKGDLESANLAVERARLEESQAQQNVRLAAKELDTASWNHSRTVLRSPVDGYVSFLDLKAGELVSQSSKAFSVVDPRRLEARVWVPQRELRRLREGQEVEIRSEVWPDVEKPFVGRVAVVNPVIEKDSGTVRVIVEVDDPSLRLKPGMYIDAEVITETHRATLLVMKKAILYENQQPVIFLAKDGVAKRYSLEAGISTKDVIEVLSLVHLPSEGEKASGAESTPVDLAAREVREDRVELVAGKLVVAGQNKLEDGMLVRIEGTPKAAGPTSAPDEAPPADDAARDETAADGEETPTADQQREPKP